MSSYDYWAHHSFLGSPSEKAIVDYLLNGKNSPYSHEIPDLSARVELLALTLACKKNKEYARNGLRELYQSKPFNEHLRQRQTYLASLDLMPTLPDITSLPAGSFALHFTFTLAKPYLSRDDTNLHILDNPVKKEWVFKLPYIAGTQWKGSLRAAIRQANSWDNTEPKLLALFGTANDHNDDGKEGRLHFYPTFFDRMSLEVINPHDRKSGTGKKPILIESVPTGTTGTFTLLYVPFDRIGKAEKETRQQIAADLELIIEGIQAMLTTYGFGAKTSSGFGVAKDEVTGTFVMNDSDVQAQQAKPNEPLEADEVHNFLKRYPVEELELSPKEWASKHEANAKADGQLHKKARAARQEYQEKRAAYEKELAAWEATANTPPPAQIKREFKGFDKLNEIVQEVKTMLNPERENGNSASSLISPFSTAT